MVLTDVMKALGDPVRWAIFVRIASAHEIGNRELSVVAAVSRPAMSYHLRVLREAGLIHARKQGRHQFYRVRREHGARLVELARTQLSIGAAQAAPAALWRRRRTDALTAPAD